jgi:benzoate/toluate 1,2-dioxygenase beta subunit
MASATEILAAGNEQAVADVSVETQLAVERFLYRQAEIIDEKQWDDWLALFGDDGIYWMPSEEDQVEGDGEPNVSGEDTYLMQMRIARNTHPRAHSQAPHNRLCHVVSNVIIESEEAERRSHCPVAVFIAPSISAMRCGISRASIAIC